MNLIKRIKEIKSFLNYLMKDYYVIQEQIKTIEGRIGAAETVNKEFKESIDNNASEIKRNQRRLDQLENDGRSYTDEIRGIKEGLAETSYWKFLKEEDKMRALKLQLSVTPAIWGNPNKLHISSSASVNSCLFNVNSGEIFVGEHTFSGSNVSILTGSHDMELTGFLRRDSEIKQGNDIKIGDGVWMASNATILGPCVIHNNAVIAAGAVVLPNTEVGEFEVYAGVPAKRVKTINTVNNMESITKAIDRENGVLFYSGWSEKIDNNGIIGHYMLEDEATILMREDTNIMDLIGDKIEVNGEELIGNSIKKTTFNKKKNETVFIAVKG